MGVADRASAAKKDRGRMLSAPGVRLQSRSQIAAQGCTALTLLLYLPRAGGKPAQYKFLHQARCRPLGGINQQIVEGKTYATI